MLSSETEIQGAYTGERLAARYINERFTAPLTAMLHERQVEAINRVMAEQQPRRTLEVAPGPGRITREVKPAITRAVSEAERWLVTRQGTRNEREKSRFVCLEYNEGMIAEGKAACDPAIDWVQGNAFELPFGQEFDFLYTFRFVRHFHRADRGRLYEQFRKALKPGGWLMLDAVNEAVSGPLRQARPQDFPIYDKLYRNELELREELNAEGFEVVRLTPVQRWFGMQHRVQVLVGPRSRRLCRWMIEGLEWISRGPCLEWIVACRRR